MTLDASIIITSYNVERYIERAIRSALAQRDVNVEIIVVDDCSRDATWDVISAIGDARVRTFRMERNSGPGAARNKGFAQARGEWIVVLDGDDAMEPERLARCLACARRMQADMVVDNLTVCREADGKEFPMFVSERFAQMQMLELPAFIRGTLAGSRYTLGYVKPIFSAAFVREHQLQYTAQMRIGEDYMIVAEALALKARCAMEPSAGYRYTVRDGSISHRLALVDLEQMKAADEAFVARFTLKGAALKAQRRRSLLREEMMAFVQFVEAIKSGSPWAALRAVAPYPLAVRHVWEALWKRLTQA